VVVRKMHLIESVEVSTVFRKW